MIEHVKTSPADSYASPKRKAKVKHDAQAIQDLIREADRQAYAARKAALALISTARTSFSTLLDCWSEVVSSSSSSVSSLEVIRRILQHLFIEMKHHFAVLNS